MGLFNRPKAAPQKQGGFVNEIKRMWTKAPERSKNELPALYHRSPRTDPVGVIARAVASTSYKLYNKLDIRKNGESAEPIIDHEIYDLLDYPIRRYPEIDGYAMLYMTEAVVKLVGEFFWLKIRDDRDNVIELNPIPPAWVAMTPTIGTPYFMIYPFGVTAGNAFPVSPDDMMWFKRSDLNDPYGRGRGDSEQLIDEFETDEYAAKSQKNMFYNDATPPYIISAPGMPQEQAEAFKQSWMQKLGGWMQRRTPGILGFEAKVTQLAMSPVEMDFVESRKFIRDESFQHYQIPPEIYGNLTNSNRSTIDSAFYLFNKNVLSNEYRFFERVINRQLIAVDFDKNIVLKFDDIVPEDEERKLKIYNDGVDRLLVTRREWRNAFKLPTSNRDDVYVSSFNLYEVPVGEKIEKPEPKETGSTESQEVEGEENGLPEKSIVLEIVKPSTKKQNTILLIDTKKEPDSRKVAIWKAFDAKAVSYEKDFIEAVKKYASNQENKVVSTIKTEINKGTEPQKAVDKAIESAFGETADKALKSALAPAWIEAMKGGRDHAFSVLGSKKSKAPINPSFEVTNELFNKWVEKYGLKKAKEINTTTYEELRKKLQEIIDSGISEGESTRDMAQSIIDECEGVYDKMSKSRANNIARTETASSVNTGSFITYKNEGVEKKEWLSSIDDRTRGNDATDEFNHIDANGEVVLIDKPFTKTGESMMYPGDPSASAGNVCNCRCSILPVIE